MRLVDLAGRWTRLRSSPLGTQFPRLLSLSDAPGLPAELTLPAPLTVLFGLNGTGKTRLLKEIGVAVEGARLVRLNELVNYLLRDLGERDDIDGLIEEKGVLLVDGDLRDAVQDLVRRDYEEVRWYPVNIADSPFQAVVGDDVVPVFVVRYGGVEYDFRDMGLGELSAHLLLWLLWYTRDIKGSLWLLDEPEAFMPAPSRSVVLAHLIETAIKQQQPMVIASHSLELIDAALEAGAAVLLSEAENVVRCVGPSKDLSDHVAGLFGLATPVVWLALCEDEAAFVMAQELFRRTTPRLWQASRFLWCKGYGDLQTIWKHLPRPSSMPDGVVNFIFIADGDKATEVQNAIESDRRPPEGRWPFVWLPGDPDTIFKEAAEGHIEFLADQLRINSPRLQGLLVQLRGREPHNWVDSIVTESPLERQGVLRALAAAALGKSPEGGQLRKAFRERLDTAGIPIPDERS